MARPLSAAEQATAPEPHEPPQFLRLHQDENADPIALETSIVRYGYDHDTADQTTHVDLVAAVHIGEREYFSTLNQLFRTYDVVLYELVAPPNARVPQSGGRPSGAIGTAQQGLTKLLGLQFQLDQIDYTARNFVHADLSPQEFNRQCNAEESRGGQCFQKSCRKAWPARMKIQKRSRLNSHLVISSALFLDPIENSE